MRYPYTVFKAKVEEHEFWIAKSTCLRGCVGQGETEDEARAELEENESVWLSVAEDVGIDIPEIPVEQQEIQYSGKFTVRVAPYVHKAAAEAAKEQGISLNQYVNDAIVEHNSLMFLASYVTREAEVVKKALQEITREAVIPKTQRGRRTQLTYNPQVTDQYAYV